MSSGYFSRHGDTIHCVQQWLQTGTRGLGGYKEPHSKCRSISCTLHAIRIKKTHPHDEAWRIAATDKNRGEPWQNVSSSLSSVSVPPQHSFQHPYQASEPGLLCQAFRYCFVILEEITLWYSKLHPSGYWNFPKVRKGEIHCFYYQFYIGTLWKLWF